jgi:hypothetical protein
MSNESVKLHRFRRGWHGYIATLAIKTLSQRELSHHVLRDTDDVSHWPGASNAADNFFAATNDD